MRQTLFATPLRSASLLLVWCALHNSFSPLILLTGVLLALLPTAVRYSQEVRMYALLGALLLAASLALGGGWLAVELAMRDADLGPPKGADRQMQAIDAEPAVTQADVATAHAILRERPHDGRAYRVLAQAADARGDREEATRLYEVAVRLAPRDRLTRAALIDRALTRDDVPAALEHLDALLRVAPGVRDTVLTELAKTLGNAAGGLPFSVFFNADGGIWRQKLGQLSKDDLAQWRATRA